MNIFKSRGKRRSEVAWGEKPRSNIVGKIRKKGRSSDRFQSKLKRKKFTDKIVKLFTLILLIGILLFGSYYAITYVVNLRSDTGGSILSEAGLVEGFEDVPAYPGSMFIFQNYKNDEVVRSFLSDGNSVYRLPPNTRSSLVVEYYMKNMGEFGWAHVNSVPFSSEEMMPGEYWVKEDRGIRIYSKLNDVWYETVSVKQANEGLSDVVKKEVERRLLLSISEHQDLLPDFPWRLKVPNEYLPIYRGTDLADLQAIDFRRVGTSSTTILEPLGYAGAFPYDTFLDRYISSYNESNKSDWGIINSIVTQVQGLEAIRASLRSSDSIGEAVVIGNPRNSVVYVIFSVIEDDPFLQYIIENIEPANSSY